MKTVWASYISLYKVSTLLSLYSSVHTQPTSFIISQRWNYLIKQRAFYWQSLIKHNQYHQQGSSRVFNIWVWGCMQCAHKQHYRRSCFPCDWRNFSLPPTWHGCDMFADSFWKCQWVYHIVSRLWLKHDVSRTSPDITVHGHTISDAVQQMVLVHH